MSELQDVLNEIKLEKDSKLLPENIKKGVQIFDITGALEGGTSTDVPVKLFATEEEMNTDTTAKVDDLAIVYKNELQNSTSSSKFQVAVFPKTVVLPETLTTSINIRYRATDNSVMFDCYGNLDANYFSMNCYSESGEIRIEYESSDGITYTRTDGGDEIIDFGTEIYYYDTDMWNDAIGYFIQTGSSYFGGLFKYTDNIPDYDYFPIYKNGTALYDGSSVTYEMNEEYTNGLTDLFNYINSKLSGASGMLVLEDYDGTTATKATLYKGKGGVYLDDTGITRIYNSVLTVGVATTSETFSEIHYFDMTAGTYSTSSLTMDVETIDGGGKITVLRELTDVYYTRIALATGNLENITIMTKNNATYFVSTEKKQQPKMICKYLPAPNQFDATSDCVYEKEFMGLNGVETGTMQKTTNLSNKEIVIKAKIWDSINNLVPNPSTTNFDRLFEKYTGKTIPMIDTSNATSVQYMFISSKTLEQVPLLNFSNVTSAYRIFEGCIALKSVPLFDFRKCENLGGVFYGCIKLEELPLFDMSNVTSLHSAFYNCSKLKTIPLFDTSKVTNMRNIFSNCDNLEEIPQLDMSSVEDANYMFDGCTNLKTVPVLNLPNIVNIQNSRMFADCPALTDESLNNILQTCVNMKSVTTYKTLARIGLTEEQATKCTTLSNYSAFIAAGWTTGY